MNALSCRYLELSKVYLSFPDIDLLDKRSDLNSYLHLAMRWADIADQDATNLLLESSVVLADASGKARADLQLLT